jgi:hypothetical protein
MVSDSFGNMTSDGRKKKLLVAVAGMAAAALLLGFVFITTTVATNNTNTAYAATDTGGKKGSGGGTGTPPTSTPTWTITGKYAPIEDPPYLVPFSQAAATVEKAFPDSKITSGERQYLTIKTKSSPPRLPSPGTGSGGVNDNNATTTTPAYIFQLTKTDDKAMYQMTVVVNGTSGQIIPPKIWMGTIGNLAQLMNNTNDDPVQRQNQINCVWVPGPFFINGHWVEGWWQCWSPNPGGAHFNDMITD